MCVCACVRACVCLRIFDRSRYDGTNVGFWLNSGDAGVNTRDTGDMIVDPDGLNIGRADVGREYFRGYVDEVQIFSAPADQQAVDRMFTGESGGRR